MGKRKEKKRVREKGRRAEDGGGEKKKRRRERKRGKSGRKSRLKAARETFFLLEKHRGGAARASLFGQAGPAASTRHYSAAEFYSPMRRDRKTQERDRRKIMILTVLYHMYVYHACCSPNSMLPPV